jgi:G3E family GTPase
MEDAVMRLFSRREDGQVPRFERLIIEPSGLSDPAPIAQAILRNPVMAASMRLEAIVTTVDAMFADRQLERHPETRKQIALADRIVVTKTDMATMEAIAELRGRLRGINPVAPIMAAAHGDLSAGVMFPPSFLDTSATPAPARSGLFAEAVDPDHLARIASVSLFADQPLQWREFDTWLRSVRLGHAETLLRVKGLLDITGAPGPVVVQGVHHVLNAPVVLDAWPDADRRSRLVLIADPATIEAARQSWADALPGLIAA